MANGTTTRHEQIIDTALAAAYDESARASIDYANAANSIHIAAGDKSEYVYDSRRGRVRNERRWCMTLDDAIDATPSTPWDARRHAEALDELAQAHARLEAVTAEIRALDAQYTGWSRFFLVVSSDGHIHSSRTCSTCNWQTEYAWLPDVSGLTEAEAVAAHGERLCSVCFPSAPVEWVEGYARKSKSDADAARQARADAKAAKEAKRAAYWAERHYGIRRVRDGHIYGGTTWEREQKGQTLKAAIKDARDYSSYGDETWEAIDLKTGEVVA